MLILGGGLSGLSAAYYLRQKLPSAGIQLIEASSRLGGWVHTTRTNDGVIFEHGPHTIRPVGDNGINTLNLIEQLGLGVNVQSINRSHPAAKNRMVYCQESLHLLPSSLGALFKTQSPFSKPLILSLLSDLTSGSKKCTDDNVHSFFKRRIGSDVADFAVAPLIRGVCAGDAHEISVKMLFRALFEAEQEHNSIIKGLLIKSIKNISKEKKVSIIPGDLAKKSKEQKWSVYTLDDGLQKLPETLESKLLSNNVTISKNDKCEHMNINSNNVEIYLKSGKKIKGSNVISSIPAPELQKLLGDQHLPLKKMLSQCQSATVVVVNIRYKGNILKSPAFGFLVPPSEKVPLLGVIFDSVCFSNPSGDTILTAMMGGHNFHPNFTNMSLEDMVSTAVKSIAEILNIKSDPIEHKAMILNECIPQYTVGHYERIEQIFRYIKDNKLPIKLIGASYNGISINDVIMSAKNAVDELC